MEERVKVALAYLEKAREHLRAAEVSIRHRLYRDAISRAYYAVYSASYSLLYLMGKSPKTHSDLRSSFGLLVKEGVVESEYGKILSRLYEMRETSDYDPFSFYGEEEASQAISDAKMFLDRMEELLESIKNSITDRKSRG